MISVEQAIELLRSGDARLSGEDNYMTEGELLIMLGALRDFFKEEEEDKRISYPFKIGSEVFLINYENEIPIGYSGFIFLMANKEYALITPTIDDENDPSALCYKNYHYYFLGCGTSTFLVPIYQLHTLEDVKAKLKNWRECNEQKNR